MLRYFPHSIPDASSAQYTYATFKLHATWAWAICSLACVQGFYRNKYGAFIHVDTNIFGESWALMRLRELEEWSARHGLVVLPTVVPQLFVALHSTPNKTVWTAFLQRLLHSTGPAPPLSIRRPEGWVPSRFAGDSFDLQARGTKAYADGVKHWVWGEDE